MPPETITLEWFAENYHFTEEMTGSLSVEALDWWPLIRAARMKVSETKSSQAQRMQQNTAASHNGMPFSGMKTPGSG